jgi:2,3-bisphosphoglycerate-independent phosphoglycerate mutase
MKYVVLIGDGMADYPIEEKGGKTPLELAATPCMDMLAQKGMLGLVNTIPEGMEPGSDVANLAAMGYDPRKYYSGRAPIEAASIGVALAPSDIAFRCNLVTLADKDGGLCMDDYSAGHIATAEAAEIISGLKKTLDSPEITFYPGVSYRHLMVWKNGTDKLKTTPPHDISGRKIDDYLPRGEGAERVRQLMEQSRTVLPGLEINKQRALRGDKPVSSIWLWGQGRALKIPRFADMYGVSGSVISAVDLVKGLGICAGLASINVPGATGYLDTNYAGKVAAALQALETGDFVYVHVEAPDEASHKGSFSEKMQAIEDFDCRIVRPMIQGLEKRNGDFKVLIMPDHPTPLCTKTHASDPVPFVLYDSANRDTAIGGQRGYCEKDARASGVVVDEGARLMNHFIRGAAL